jgi:ubiquinone biosynthesis protein COQ9
MNAAAAAPVERSADRDAAVRAVLAHVPALGWTHAALAAGLRDVGRDPVEASSLFPRGPVGAIEAWADLADRGMEQAAAAEGIGALRVPARIRRLVELRLRQAAPHREALRRAFAVLALPWNAPVAARCTARTVDAMWHAAGDRSADFSWYTRRATLAAIYTATVAYWLRGDDRGGEGAPPDDDAGVGAALAFLDRRLGDLARFGRCRAALTRRLRAAAAPCGGRTAAGSVTAAQPRA